MSHRTTLDYLRGWVDAYKAVPEDATALDWPLGFLSLTSPIALPRAVPSERPALHTFWSLPYGPGALQGSPLFWGSRFHAWCCWSLSVWLARRWHKEVRLSADSAGCRLAEKLGLPYTLLDSRLDCLASHSPKMWSTGKLQTFALQQRPYLHLDWDVLLLAPVPPLLLDTFDLSAQSVEPLWVPGSRLSQVYARSTLDVLTHQAPPLWGRPPLLFEQEQAYNLGILGVNQPLTLSETSQEILGCLKDARASFETLEWPAYSIMFWEQLLLAQSARLQKKSVGVLLPLGTESASALSFGYAHCISNSKKNPVVGDQLSLRLSELWPEQHERLLRLDSDLPLNLP